jgi:predicted nucleic-acid-binding protein
MIGVDTNVFLRFSIDDDGAQHAAARDLLARAGGLDQILIDPIVWVECEWVLRARYGLGRDAIADRLGIVLDARQFVVRDRDAFARALATYRANRADLAESLVCEMNRAAGCRTTYTFDRDASRLVGMSKLRT